MSDDRVREIQQRVEKATKGPWVLRMVGGDPGDIALHAPDEQFDICNLSGPLVPVEYILTDAERDNADFLVHSREDIPYLVSRLQAAEQQRDQQHALFVAADAILDEIGDHFNNEKRGTRPLDESDRQWLLDKTCDERPYAKLIGDFHLLEYFEQKRLRQAAEQQVAALNAYGREMESRIQSLTEAQRWIPVSEKLPERGVLVLVYTTSGRIDTDAVNKHDGLWECDDDWTVSHWRPLPEPPVAHNEGETK